MNQNKSSNKYTKHSRHRKQKAPWPLIAAVVGGLALIVAAVFAFNQPPKPKATIEVTGSPSLRADREEVDLGDVKLGQTVTVSFELTNVGDQTLRFSEAPYIEVKEGC